MAEKKPNAALTALRAAIRSDDAPAFILMGLSASDFIQGHRLEGTIAIVGAALVMAILRAGRHMFAASVTQLIAAFRATRHG